MAVLHQIKPGYLELSFEWKLIANTSYKCVLFVFFFLLLCVRVIVERLRRSTWRALEANDAYFVTTPGCPCSRARACPRVIGSWSDRRPSENQKQLRMADAPPGRLRSDANRLETFHMPLSALCSGWAMCRTTSSHSGKQEREGGKTHRRSPSRRVQTFQRWGKK